MLSATTDPFGTAGSLATHLASLSWSSRMLAMLTMQSGHWMESAFSSIRYFYLSKESGIRMSPAEQEPTLDDVFFFQTGLRSPCSS